MSGSTKKRILFVVPEFNFLVLRMIPYFHEAGYDISIASAYFPTSFFRFLVRFIPLKSLRVKILKRIGGYDTLVGQIPKDQLYYLSPLRVFYELLKDSLKPTFFLSNTFKRILEDIIIKKIPFKKFQYIYSYDTCGAQFITQGIKNNCITILESRGPEYEFNKMIEQKASTLYLNKERDEPNPWYYIEKLKYEPDKADYIVTYSEFHSSHFLAIGKNKEQVFSIPIRSQFIKSNEIIEARNNSIEYIYFGALSLRKGFFALIKAWEELMREEYSFNNCRLTLIGNAFEEVVPFLEKLPKNVVYKGFMEHSALKDQLKKSHVFVFPTLLDTFAMVIAEAASFNLPIITTSHCGASELLKNGENSLVYPDPFSIEQLKSALLFFHNNPEKVGEFSNNLKNAHYYNQEDEQKIALEAISKIR